MNVTLVKEDNPVWDLQKKQLFSQNSQGFSFKRCTPDDMSIGTSLEHNWYKVMNDTEFVRFALLVQRDFLIAEPEMCLSICGQGIGTVALKLLELEGRKLGFRFFEGSVKRENTKALRILRWLKEDFNNEKEI